MFTTRNKRDVIVAKTITKAALSATDYPTSSAIQNGEVFVMGWNPASATNKEKLIQATNPTYTTYPKIKIGWKSQGVLKYTNWIDGRYVKTYAGKAGVAAQEQIYHVGYNGSSGSIDTTQGTRFTMRIQYKGDKEFWSEQTMVKPYTTPYDSTPTQAEIAQNLVTQVNADPSATVYLENRNSGAAADPSTAATMIVTFGSDVVGLPGTTSASTEQAIGTILRIGWANASIDPYTGATNTASGVGTTVPVYVITANSSTDSTLSATQVRVHTKFQGPTDAALDATSGNCGVVTVGANWGFSVKTMPMLFQVDQFPYFKQKFDLTFTNLGSTTLTKTQESKRGNGVAELVAQDEWENKAQSGALNSNVWPLDPTYSQTDVITAPQLYGTVVVEHASVKPDTIEGMRSEPEQIIMYFPNTTAGGSTPATQWTGTAAANNPDVKAMLDSWFGSLPYPWPAVVI